MRQHRRRRGRRRRRPRARPDAGVRRRARHRARHDRAGRRAGDRRRRCRRARHADRAARRTGDRHVCDAGKHVQVEIPLCDDLADGEAVVAAQQDDRPRRDVRAHPALQPEPPVGAPSGSRPASYAIQQMDVQTYFFRRTNTNALGQPRSWTDHLLWHHAAHTVDLFAYQTGQPDRGRPRRCRGRRIPTSASPWTCRSSWRPTSGADLHAVAVVQQRRSVRHDVPLHRRHRHLRRELRRPRDRARRTDRRVRRRRVDERHRTAGP